MNKTLIFALMLCMGYVTWMRFFYTPQNFKAYQDYQRVNSQIQTFAGYTMTSLEPYEGEFRIFSKKNYYFGQ